MGLKAFVVLINGAPTRCFFSKHECEAWLRLAFPTCPEGLRVVRMRNGYWEDTPPKDITAKLYLGDTE